MTTPTFFNVTNGLTTFGPEIVRLIDALEGKFLSWATAFDAEAMIYPPLMRVKDLDNFDYFQNFPHLALMTSHIHHDQLSEYANGTESVSSVCQEHLTDVEYALPSAACYNIYLHLSDTTIDQPKYITTVAQCFRNEKKYSGLARLWGFKMREIVCIGDADTVHQFLGEMKEIIQSFVSQIKLPLELEVATDPFYDGRGRRALMQKLSPVKFEFVYGGSVAIASANFHRNFFGEKCDLRTADGAFAFSGCVAFGVERWIHALMEHFDGDIERICELLK